MTLFGKARVAVWWWGRNQASNEHPNRNTWLVRSPIHCGELSEDDEWDVIHQHAGKNLGFRNALKLFRRHISSIAATAEAVSVALGAPFLRSDFFIGSETWGVRLNEVA